MVSIFKSMTVRILVCLEFSLFLTSIVAGDPAYHKRYCGRVLTESLALICEGEYETIIPMEYQKRSGKYELMISSAGNCLFLVESTTDLSISFYLFFSLKT